MLATSTKLVIGRGELYLNRFVGTSFVGDGEVYFGNTPGFSISRESDEIDRVKSVYGRKESAGKVVVQEVFSGSVTTDNMSVENLQLFFGADASGDGQYASSTDLEESFSIRRGRFYQLGQSRFSYGVRHLLGDVDFFIGTNEIDAETNFLLIRDEGRFQVLPNAADVFDGDQVRVVFGYDSSRSKTITPVRQDELRGSLRYIAKLGVGPTRSIFFPYVVLKPVGQFDMKGDQWQQIGFQVEVRRLTPATEFFYILESAPAGLTLDEELALAETDFLYWEDILNTVVNVDIPSHHY